MFCSLTLAPQKSVRPFANQFNSMILPLNILINSAGVMLCSFQLSEDEVEMQFITSHRGIVCKTNCHQHMKQTISMADILIQGIWTI